jgi:hypothetical protein
MRFYIVREELPGRPYIFVETSDPLWAKEHGNGVNEVVTEAEVPERSREIQEAVKAWREGHDREMARAAALELLERIIDIPSVDPFNFPFLDAVEAYSDEPACQAVLEVAEALALLRRTLDAEPVGSELDAYREAWRQHRVEETKTLRDEIARAREAREAASA